MNKNIIGDCTLTLSVKNNKIQVSDGYHTFDELYEHRITLYLALFKVIWRLQYEKKDTKREWISLWISKYHFDGSEFEGRFIAGIIKDGKQISYHIPNSYWEEFAKVSHILDKGIERDGHTSDDVLKRLLDL